VAYGLGQLHQFIIIFNRRRSIMGFFDWFSASKNNAENSGSSVKNSQDIQDKDEIQVQASNDLAIQNEYETEISESDEEVTSEAATKVEIQDS